MNKTIEKSWNRVCKTKKCHGLAKPLSNYCKPCHKKRQVQFNEVINE